MIREWCVDTSSPDSNPNCRNAPSSSAHSEGSFASSKSATKEQATGEKSLSPVKGRPCITTQSSPSETANERDVNLVTQPRPSNDILISFHSDSQDDVLALECRLRRLGFSCWLNAVDDKIDISSSTAKRNIECEALIKYSGVYLVCITTKYVRLKRARRLVRIMDAQDKRIIPLLFEKLDWPPLGPVMVPGFGPIGIILAPLLYIGFSDPADRKTWCVDNFKELTNQLAGFDIRPIADNRIGQINRQDNHVPSLKSVHVLGIATLLGRIYILYDNYIGMASVIHVFNETTFSRLSDISTGPPETKERQKRKQGREENHRELEQEGKVEENLYQDGKEKHQERNAEHQEQEEQEEEQEKQEQEQQEQDEEQEQGRKLDLCDIASCSKHRCLYVRGGIIWRLSLNESDHQWKEWSPVSGDKYRSKISVTSEGHVLITQSNPPRIDIHGHNSKIIGTIALPINATHAVETPTGNYVVCLFGSFDRLREYTKNGVLMWSYDGNPIKGPPDETCLWHLTTDKDGRVCAIGKGRVILLDSTLNNGLLLVSNTIHDFEPLAMCCSRETGRLIVIANSSSFNDRSNLHVLSHWFQDTESGDQLHADETRDGVARDIFISYQWDAQKQVNGLYTRLTELGFSCWFDIKKMGGGSKLYDEIDRGISGCKVVVSCVTSSYLKSPNCRYEINLCAVQKKEIIPLLFETMTWPPPSPMGPVLEPYSFIDITREDVIKPLLRRLKQFDIRGSPAKIELETMEIKKIATLPANRSDSTLAHLLGRIYVFVHSPNTLQVFNSNTFTHVEDVVLEGKTSDGEDGGKYSGKDDDQIRIKCMQSCSRYRCLYLYDDNMPALWRITELGLRETTDHEESDKNVNTKTHGIMEKWLSIPYKNCSCSFSVTSTGRVLLVSDNRLTVANTDFAELKNYHPTIDIYGHDSTLLETVPIPGNFGQPYQAVETASGEFVIVYGSLLKSDGRVDQHHLRVCLLNSCGELIRADPNNAREYPYSCHEIAVDAKGRIYFWYDVTDGWTGYLTFTRVEVFDRTLLASRVLKNNLQNVGYYDEDEVGRLLMSKHYEQGMEVYSIQYCKDW